MSQTNSPNSTGFVTQNFSLEFITPAFVGGADPQQAALRSSTIKGVLRFWWRALHGRLSTEEMWEKEAQIFGSAQKGLKSRVWLRLINIQDINNSPNKSTNKIQLGRVANLRPQPDIFAYMAFGTQPMGGNPAKEYFQAGTTFDLALRFDPRLSAEQRDSVIEALQALSALGGMGSKSRNGFGSVQVTHEEGRPVSGNWLPKEFIDKEFINNVFKHKAAQNTGHPTPKRIWLLASSDDWKKAHEICGKLYIQARKKIDINLRKFIAAPMNIMRDKTPIDNPSYQEWKRNIPRRGKPYFITIKKSEGKYLSIITLLDSKYADGLALKKDPNKEYQQKYEEAINEMNNKISELKKEV